MEKINNYKLRDEPIIDQDLSYKLIPIYYLKYIKNTLLLSSVVSPKGPLSVKYKQSYKIKITVNFR